MSRDELRKKLSNLEETREAAKQELEEIEGRQARLRELERGKDTLLQSYASVVPGALGELTPEERHRIYNMLRLNVLSLPDKTLEVTGVLGADPSLGTSGLVSACLLRPSTGKVDRVNELRGGQESMDRRVRAHRREPA